MQPPRLPVPVSAVYTLSTDVCVVTFDTKLLTNPNLNVANWGGVVKTNGIVLTFGAVPFAVASEYTVTLPCVRGLPGLAPSVVDYNPPPFDVIGRNHQAVAAFVNFPLTIVP